MSGETRGTLPEGEIATMKYLWLTLVLCIWLPSAQARPRVVAHRGGAALAPENTMAAFHKALALKADAIELDIHPSGDGVLMVIHDETTKRTFHQEGVVSQMTSLELELLGVPRLESVLELCRGKCQVVIEIKHPHGARNPEVESKLSQLLQKREYQDDVIVISFDALSLKLLHKLRPELATGYLFSELKEPEKLKAELGVRFLGPHHRLITRDWLNKAHAVDLKVNAWTVNEADDLSRLARWGVDYITTDRPDRLQQLLESP